jgi:hypothetical protein
MVKGLAYRFGNSRVMDPKIIFFRSGARFGINLVSKVGIDMLLMKIVDKSTGIEKETHGNDLNLYVFNIGGHR